MTTERLDQRALRIGEEMDDSGQKFAWRSEWITEFARRLTAEQVEQCNGPPAPATDRLEPVAFHFVPCADTDVGWYESDRLLKPGMFFCVAPQQDSLDGKRLDWMEKNVSAIRDIGWLGGSLRVAIDAAMREGGRKAMTDHEAALE